jgi:2-(1,2-epoxy-1,2-dihydrophenyl)acetyl-CoA isomerase
MGYEKIKLTVSDNIARVTLNDPDILNAVGEQMSSELRDVFQDLAKGESGARVVLLSGEGRGFCSGANLAEGFGSGNAPEFVEKALQERYHPLMLAMRDLEMPIVAAVNGVTAGIGLSIAMMSDLIYATREAYFLQAFVRIGLVPDGGSTYLLPRKISWPRAMELSLLGEKLSAEKAHEWGLVNGVFDDIETLNEGVLKVVEKLSKGPRSLGYIRKAMWSTFSNTFEEQLDLEASLQGKAAGSEDAMEGISAFVEKRPANFNWK